MRTNEEPPSLLNWLLPFAIRFDNDFIATLSASKTTPTDRRERQSKIYTAYI